MSIKDIRQKIKGSQIYLVSILVLTAGAIMGVLQLLALNKDGGEGLTIKPLGLVKNTSTSSSVTNIKGLLVASKSGKKYHLPTCSGAKRISEANKIWFTSYEEAKNAGYTAATNCKGLQ